MLLYGVSQERRPDQTETVNNVLTPTFGSLYGSFCLCWLATRPTFFRNNVTTHRLYPAQCSVSSARCKCHATTHFSFFFFLYKGCICPVVTWQHFMKCIIFQCQSTCAHWTAAVSHIDILNRTNIFVSKTNLLHLRRQPNCLLPGKKKSPNNTATSL